MQALRFGTAAAAELLGIGEELGTLEPGKKADLVAVAGNPLQDIGALREVRLVLRNGVKVWPSNRVTA
jgi:imidazolonepropionase-like amidohydrolase